ncbi:M81 family metallopeptidase [Cognatishimia sp. F0-27]|uniref:M81 family metallopeptidase n=1 Tax=Cognatishimia sp. F0-27 TaxID=2816855 RepID=UPI001D0C0F1B|nr:M81 family metallopeptidase [Cognatishimia sp. F0-27]MCC1491865.1 M81 family metallopeptidase [Cognatishimia sp. F0-27]
MTRVAVLGFHLESNRFAPPTRRADFDLRTWLEGDAILADAQCDAPRQGAEIPAFLEEIARHIDAEILPVLVAAAEPGGPLEEDVLAHVLNTIRHRLTDQHPVDAVYIASHGAMVGVETLDPDGALLEVVREAVGPDVPIVATLDLHANLSDRMAAAADCLIGYRTNPHVDQADVAREAAVILARMVTGCRVHMASVRLPLTPTSVTLLTDGPGAYAERIRDAAQLTDPEGVIVNATVLGGFVYSDTPDNGIATVVTATHRATAEREAARLAGLLWADRERFDRTLTSIPEAVRAVTADDGARWILSDAGDNPGGGGRGTSTDLLRALIGAGAGNVLYGLFIDPDLAREATAAGLGSRITARFLRRGSDGFGDPFSADARVLAISDGRVVGRRGLVAGRQVDLGPTAALAIGGLTVVVSSNRKQCADPVYFEHLGFDPGAYRAVVVKSRGHFRAGFDEFFNPDQVLEVDTKGLTSPILSNFTFRGLPRPVYPLDADVVWTPPDWAIPHLQSLDLLP